MFFISLELRSGRGLSHPRVKPFHSSDSGLAGSSGDGHSFDEGQSGLRSARSQDVLGQPCDSSSPFYRDLEVVLE